MRRRRPKQLPRLIPQAVPPSRPPAEKIYVLVEQARLRCEQLRSQAQMSVSREALQEVHRELGLAGLSASTQIPSHVRHGLLLEAHERSTQLEASSTGEAHAVALIMHRAERALDHELIGSGLPEHLMLARSHLLRAHELLGQHVNGLDPESLLKHSPE